MITLKELSDITEIKAKFEKEEKIREEIEHKEKIEKQYQDVIRNLDRRLLSTALDGKRKLSVIEFSALSYENISKDLDKKMGAYRNYYCAWGKTVFESDVLENMTGNFKRIYDYLKENNLNPKIDYWTDGGGYEEGFKLVVEW